MTGGPQTLDDLRQPAHPTSVDAKGQSIVLLRFSLAALLLAAPAAQAFEAATVDLSFGSLAGDPGTFSSARLVGETAFDLGRWGVQIGATLSSLSETDQNSARILVWRELGERFRLGLSTSQTSYDGAQTNTSGLAFHLLWTAPGAHIDAAIQAPDHLDTTGAFSYDISGEQRLTPRLAVTTDLYRLTTDEEFDDFWSISLGLSYDLTNRITLTGAGIRSTADDYNFDNRMARLGAEWHLSPALTASATVLHLVTADDGTQTGLELALRRDFGAAPDRARLFDSGPLTDRFIIGAFEP
jgi:hypothetical protein